MEETEHLLSTQANTNRLQESIKNSDMHNKPLKITLEFYDKKISAEVDHSDLKLDELHDLWLGILKGMGYHSNTIDEYYE
tara:strand:- start:809 stop:1048 length:240 start_codon:yes stop_codon:yes gene_type:complete